MSFTVNNKDETTRFFIIIQTKANILTADQKQKQKQLCADLNKSS